MTFTGPAPERVSGLNILIKASRGFVAGLRLPRSTSRVPADPSHPPGRLATAPERARVGRSAGFSGAGFCRRDRLRRVCFREFFEEHNRGLVFFEGL